MPLPRWLIGLAIALIALLVGGTGVGLVLEQRDEFCAACHTEPETTYVRQSRDTASPRSPTLAAFHHRLEGTAMESRVAFKCIDCHGGVGPAARLTTLYQLGVGDALAFLSGRYEQPATTHRPLPDANCTRCHAREVAVPGFENHFHNKLGAPTAPSIACVDCHVSHTDQVDPREKYIRRALVFPHCNDCHRSMGGPPNLR